MPLKITASSLAETGAPMASVRAGEATPAPHFLHIFPSFGHGGVPIRISNIINHTGAAYRHTVIALDGNFGSSSRLAPNAPVELLPLSFRKERPLASLALFRRTLNRLRPDLLLTYNWGAVEWCLVQRLFPQGRHIHLESGFGTEEADRQIPRRVLLRRLALRRCDCIIVPSRHLVDLAESVWKLPARKIAYVPNGVDLRKYGATRTSMETANFRRSADDIVIGTVAPLRPEKNLSRLLRVFARVADDPRLRLVIVGDGPERPKLEALTAELGLRGSVVFAGHFEAPELALGAIDIFAISSDTEQMPNSVLQAMAAARAVVGTDVGDVKFILAPENQSFVVDKDDEAGFAAVLRELAAQPIVRIRLGHANREHARDQYDEERMFAAYRTIFDQVLGTGQCAY